VEALGHVLRRLLESDVESVYETVEHVLVTTAFSYCDSNQVRTAKRLAISRNILRAQLKRFGFLGNQVDESIEVGEEDQGAEAVAA
jgi:sigma-54-specific transcriptional regulator